MVENYCISLRTASRSNVKSPIMAKVFEYCNMHTSSLPPRPYAPPCDQLVAARHGSLCGGPCFLRSHLQEQVVVVAASFHVEPNQGNRSNSRERHGRSRDLQLGCTESIKKN